MYGFLLALIYIAFISLGLPDSLLGSGRSAIHLEIGVPVSYMGIVSMVISGGTIVSSFMSDKLTKRLGTRWVTVISVFDYRAPELMQRPAELMKSEYKRTVIYFV